MNQHLIQAIAAARTGKKPQAKVLLARVIKDEPENVNAWFLLSSLADTEEQKIQHLEKVLELQPGHPAASEQLAELLPPAPEPVEEAFPAFEIPEMVSEVESEPAETFPAPDEMPSNDAPDDPDEAMAWLERLAADQGAPLNELPTMFESMDAAESTAEFPITDYTEAATPDDDLLYEERLDSDFQDSDFQDSDVPEDMDDAMAWLERLAADQGAPMNELPSLFDSEETAETDIELDFEMDTEIDIEIGAEGEDDFSWLDESLAEGDDYLETTPTLLDAAEEERARTLIISNDFDFVNQSKGDSIPAWLAGEEGYLGTDTVITGPLAEEDIEQPEPENLPDWLNERPAEGWLGDEGEKSGQVVWKAGQGDESLKPARPGSKKEQEAKKKSAAKQTAASGSNTLFLGLLVLIALILIVAILYILIFQPI